MKKRFKTIAFVCLATMAVVSCDENNDNPIPSGETFDLGDGSNAYEISSNMTLTYPNTYNLKGFVYVTEGATLTIEPGVVIKGEKESKATLVVERRQTHCRGYERTPHCIYIGTGSGQT